MSRTFAEKFARSIYIVRDVFVGEGLVPSIECGVRVAGTPLLGMSPAGHPRIQLAIQKFSDLYFDVIHGVDTSGVIDLPEMVGNGRHYIATPARAWDLVFKHLTIDPSRFTYVDFGCGKGRTLLLAARKGFKQIVGVDISRQLLDIARRNMARRKAACELICGDVREFQYPDGPLVLFMYNPFFVEVMERVLQNLSKTVKENPREIYVLYYSAELKELWQQSGFSVLRACNYPYPNYVIYATNGFEAGSA
jgi:SAM-dependent methyltransferase